MHQLWLGAGLGFLLLLGSGCGTATAASQYDAGVTALAAGNHDTARQQFVAALRTDPYLLEAHLNLASLDLAAGDVEAAMTRLEGLSEVNGLSDPRVEYLKAQGWLAEGEIEAATDKLEVLANDETLPEAWYILGVLEYEAKNFGEAQWYFEQYLERREAGGFTLAARKQLNALALELGEELIADAEALLEPPTETSTEPESIPEGTPAVEDNATPDPTPAIEPAPEPKPVVEKPAVKPIEKPTEKPAESKPTPTPKPVKPKPAPVKPLSAEEQAWVDAGSLEENEKYAAALEQYRVYLRLAPLGEHAAAAKKGILRCEAALKTGAAE